MKNVDDVKRLAQIFSTSRYNSKKSQEYMALSLGVSKNTISNWEKGLSSPNLSQALEWFKVLGLNPLPYYYHYMFPQDSQTKNSDKELIELISMLPEHSKELLVFILKSSHGSPATSVLEMVTAHLHTDFKCRVAAARLIAENYEMCEKLNELVLPETAIPDIQLLKRSVEKGKDVVISRNDGYCSLDVSVN